MQRGGSEGDKAESGSAQAQPEPAASTQEQQLAGPDQRPRLHPLQQHPRPVDSAHTPVSTGTCTATHFGSNSSLVSPNTSLRTNLCSQGGGPWEFCHVHIACAAWVPEVPCRCASNCHGQQPLICTCICRAEWQSKRTQCSSCLSDIVASRALDTCCHDAVLCMPALKLKFSESVLMLLLCWQRWTAWTCLWKPTSWVQSCR